ncbi:tRNA nucleotidyltransferase [Pseudodesulfovibrio sp.]|uniref:tRNA nucleotidyltransferase n=1 Tax=unclassified Pseudodesulfovibrio TaxID=2661612 RepID=UPI003B00A2A4
MKLYLAGGAVRDLLLGRSFADRDYLITETSRETFQAEHPEAKEVGHAFPVFLVNGIEFSFPRADSLEMDLRSRDLTVNALLLDENGELTCHPQGLEDLHKRMLRPASRQSFFDDPLRVLRAARFWAVLPDFTPHEELIDTMRDIASQGLLETIAPDRIGAETRKALSATQPGNFLRLLERTGCLAPWFAEFADSESIPAGPLPYHDTNVLEHTCRVMDALAGDPIAVWAGLCHDIGKTMTDADEWPHHYGHDIKGESPSTDLAQRLRLSNAYASAGANGARWHMVAANYAELRPGTKVDLLMHLHQSRTLETVFALVRADYDRDLAHQARQDLAIILKVHLPLELRNLDAESGRHLRDLRAQALITASKNKT